MPENVSYAPLGRGHRHQRRQFGDVPRPATLVATGGPANCLRCALPDEERLAHSHSMVPGGLEVMSRVTRLTSATSLVMRVEIRSITS